MPHTEYTGIVLELEQILTLVERKVTVPLEEAAEILLVGKILKYGMTYLE